MDRETRAKIKFTIIVGGIVLLLVAGVIGWVYKISGIQKQINPPEIAVSSVQAAPSETHKNVFAAEEEQREIFLEQQREAQEIVKKQAKKEKSNECVFWRLQHKQGKSAVAAKKVEQYCVLSPEELSSKL